MADARRREAWDRTSHLMAAIINPHRDAEQHPDPYTPEEINPFTRDDHATPPPLRPQSAEERKRNWAAFRNAAVG
jgi:hypothetical protein